MDAVSTLLKCLKSKRYISDIEKAKAEVSTERITLRNLIALICNHMKKDYLAWNKDTVDDKKIAEDLYELSNGELQMTDDIVRLMAERLNQNYRPKTNYTNNRQNNKRRY